MMLRMIDLTGSIGSLLLVLLLGLALPPAHAQVTADPALPGPHGVASMSITTNNPDTASELETKIYYPSENGSTVNPGQAPYPTLVFARGFLSFPSSYAGWGEHLASWGYIVAIPDFPSEDREVRASDVRHLFSYLEAENINDGSPFYRNIDVDRFGVTGHSAGGLSSLIVAARDRRIKAVAALDPAGSPVDGWDYETEAPTIVAPLAIIGAPAQLCNADGQYNDIYPRVGSTHKAKFVIANGSHCDFMSTEDQFQIWGCSLLCGAFSEDRLALAQRYATAWLNYYLAYNTAFHSHLYGDEADLDIQAGLITRDVETAPRDVAATGRLGAIELGWTLYDHPIVAGYDIYRSPLSGDYPTTPSVQVERQSAYVDADVLPGERYFYVLRSRDGAGNQHQTSDEVNALSSTAAITASFVAGPTDCCAPLTVVFTDTSQADASLVPTNTIESWDWDFGDGMGCSTDQDPSYAYQESGTYTVTLTVTDTLGGSATVVKGALITVNPLPTASLSASPTDCCLPLTVAFTDSSIADTSVLPSNAIEDWHWTFGDGAGSSTEQHPTYIYEQPGIYTVTLTVTDTHGCSQTAAWARSIAVNPLPAASFEVSPTGGLAPLEVAFMDRSVADTSIVANNRIEGWHWEFGDGEDSSTEQNPVHIYQQPGIYTVTLTIADSHGCSDKAQSILAVVAGYDCRIYLPLVSRDATAETHGNESPTLRDARLRIGMMLDGVLDQLRYLFSCPCLLWGGPARLERAAER